MKINNRPQLEYAVYQTVINECRDSAYHQLREHTERMKEILGNPSTNQLREQLEQMESHWDDTLAGAKARGPLSVEYLNLRFAEMRLIGDVIEALDALELTNPHDIRDSMDLVMALERTPNEHKLREAVETIDDEELNKRFEELYPSASPEDD